LIMAFGKYVVSTLCFVILILLFFGGFNFVVDPYAVFNSIRITGFNEYKSEINNKVRPSKIYQPLSLSPEVLIVGNSRVEMGFDPKNPCLSKLWAGVYNLGVPGASVEYQAAMALNLVYQKPVKKILLGIDFTDYLVLSNKASRRERQLPSVKLLKYLPDGRLNESHYKNKLIDYYKFIFSLNALVDSTKTIFRQNEYAPTRTSLGFNPALDFSASTSIEGVNSIFRQKEHDLEKKYSLAWSMHYQNGDISEDFSYLENFLKYLAEHQVEVIVFTNPLHEHFWSLISKVNLTNEYNHFMSEVVSIIHRVGGDIVFWDFSSDSKFIHEDLPEPGTAADKKGLQWFWEPAHYKKVLGDKMINTMFSSECGGQPEFGRKIYSTRH